MTGENVRAPIAPAIAQAEGSTSLHEGAAWRKAAESGFDMSLIEASVAKTVWERLLEHDDALALAEQLRAALHRRYEPS